MKRRDFIRNAMKGAALAAGSSMMTLPARAFEVGRNEYEFIIVGSGAGGGPLAVNLAKAGFKVLLIEAGGEKQPMSAQIPAYHAKASEDPEIAWNFFVKHYNDKSMHGKWNELAGKEGVLYPRTSMIGGCTNSNAMICLYPDDKVWNQIYGMTGFRDRSWRPSNLRKIFTDKIESAEYFSDKKKGWHHIEMSPLSLLKNESQLQKILLGAASEDRNWFFDEIWHAGENQVSNLFNLDSYLDANNENHRRDKGFLRMPKSTYLGKRFGVYDYVMESNKHLRNLTILPHSFVEKIIFDESGDELKAIGVEVLKGKNLYGAHTKSSEASISEKLFLKADKEVILCGGAFNSPQLLMLSGIGPRDQYDSHNPGAPIKDKPKLVLDGVGKNLKDRYEVSVVTELDDDISLLKDCKFSDDYKKSSSDPCLKEWMNKETRQDSVYATNGVLASIKMRSTLNTNGTSDVILFGLPGDFRGYYPGYSDDVVKSKNKFTWAVLKGHSKNRKGRVTLKNDNPLATPDINFQYFKGHGATEDMEAVLQGVKKARAINRNTFGAADERADDGYQKVGKGELYPGTDIQNDQDVRQWIQKEAWGHHASCSNKMGAHPRGGAVVDTDFKVHGTKNVRVVDASVFPEIPGLFIATSIYMISEKASEVLIKKYKS